MFLWLIKTEIHFNISLYLVVASDYILYFVYILYIFLNNITVAVMHGGGHMCSWLIFKLRNGLYMKNLENHWYSITVLELEVRLFCCILSFLFVAQICCQEEAAFLLSSFCTNSPQWTTMNQSFHKPGRGTRKQTIKEKILPVPS